MIDFERIEKNGCDDAIEWLQRYYSDGKLEADRAWEECDRPDWMIWAYFFAIQSVEETRNVLIKSAQYAMRNAKQSPIDNNICCIEAAYSQARGLHKNPTSDHASCAMTWVMDYAWRSTEVSYKESMQGLCQLLRDNLPKPSEW